jgi:hypothetical protein
VVWHVLPVFGEGEGDAGRGGVTEQPGRGAGEVSRGRGVRQRDLGRAEEFAGQGGGVADGAGVYPEQDADGPDGQGQMLAQAQGECSRSFTVSMKVPVSVSVGGQN